MAGERTREREEVGVAQPRAARVYFGRLDGFWEVDDNLSTLIGFSTSTRCGIRDD